MTTAEIEQLYIARAEDFRTLLGHDGTMIHESVALFYDGTRLFIPEDGATEWHTLEKCLPTALAVAAMTEAWRERLRNEHSVTWHDDGTVACAGKNAVAYLKEDGGWSLNPHDAVSFTYPADAYCAAVKALVAEKRKCERCHGAGWLWRNEIDPDGYHESSMRGIHDDTQYCCPDCGGTGVVSEKRAKEAKLQPPPMTKTERIVTGMAMRHEAEADYIPDATKKVQPTIESLAKRVEELENRLDGVDLERLATGAD